MINQDLCETLSNLPSFKGEIQWDPTHSFLIIRFHEYLKLIVDVGELIDLNDGLTHWHPDEEDTEKFVMDTASGNIVFIEHRSWIRRLLGLAFYQRILMMSADTFDRCKARYLRNNIRIYTGIEIIQYAK